MAEERGAALILDDKSMIFVQDEIKLWAARDIGLTVRGSIQRGEWIDFTFQTMKEYQESFFGVCTAAKMEKRPQVVRVLKLA